MKSNGLYPRVQTDTAGTAVVSQGGAVGLIETVRVSGLDRALSQALRPWRKPMAVHDPGKILTYLALSLAVGGNCLADVAVLRNQPGVFGQVASDSTVSRLVDTLASDATKAFAAIDAARAAVRARVWSLAGEHAPNHARSGKATDSTPCWRSSTTANLPFSEWGSVFPDPRLSWWAVTVRSSRRASRGASA